MFNKMHFKAVRTQCLTDSLRIGNNEKSVPSRNYRATVSKKQQRIFDFHHFCSCLNALVLKKININYFCFCLAYAAWMPFS